MNDETPTPETAEKHPAELALDLIERRLEDLACNGEESVSLASLLMLFKGRRVGRLTTKEEAGRAWAEADAFLAKRGGLPSEPNTSPFWFWAAWYERQAAKAMETD